MLLGLVDAQHGFFQAAHAWARSVHPLCWASCPLTENGYVRVRSQPSYPSPVSVTDARRQLARTIALTDHEFWADDISFLDDTVFRSKHLIGHRQITDAYLLALAVKRGGRLVTFDRGVPVEAVVGARAEHVVVLGA